MNAPVPPYGRVLTQRLAEHSIWPRFAGTSPDGQHITIWVAAGSRSAWNWATEQLERRLLLVAPADQNPADYNWTMLSEHAPVIIAPFDDPPHEFLERLAVAILRDGCSRVLIGLPSGLVRYTRRRAAA